MGIPTNPATIKANGVVMDTSLQDFMIKHLPNWGYYETSGYRTRAENSAIPGAAKDSAHMYNLARDIKFLDKDGKKVSESQARKLADTFYNHWHKAGFVQFSPSRPESDPLGGKGYHLHVNLPRWIQKTTSLFGVGFVLIILGVLVHRYVTSKKDFN